MVINQEGSINEYISRYSTMCSKEYTECILQLGSSIQIIDVEVRKQFVLLFQLAL